MGKGKFRPTQLRNRLIDYDEIRTLELSPEEPPPKNPTVQNFISIRQRGWSRQIPSLSLSVKRQLPRFMFPQVVQRH